MTTLPDLEPNSKGTVRREDFERALFNRVVKPRSGWDGTLAMVTLGLMFTARSLSDIATAIRGLSVNLHRLGSRV